jgi:hypothetical protein
MAVKPITNKQAVVPSNIDRSSQKSFKNDTAKGNRSRSVNPGKDYTKNYSITLKDIDTSVMNHIKNIMKPTVREANEIIKVPVLYANEERWKAVRKNGVLRDKNGSVMLPLIIMRRTDLSMNADMPLSFDNDVQGKFIKVARNSKWSKDNRYDRFAVQTGKKPVQEILYTGMPDFVVCTYSIMMFTNYMEQMNLLNNLWIEHLETYFGDSENYKFLSSLDGGISDSSEMSADGERLIKNEFSLSIKGYMIPEFTDSVFGKTSEMTKELTPSKVVFGFEGDVSSTQISSTSGTGGTGETGESSGGSAK